MAPRAKVAEVPLAADPPVPHEIRQHGHHKQDADGGMQQHRDLGQGAERQEPDGQSRKRFKQ